MKDLIKLQFEIHAQEGTTVELVDKFLVSITQEDENAHDGIAVINVRGPENLRQFIAALERCRQAMPGEEMP